MPFSDAQIRKLKPVVKNTKHVDCYDLYLLQTPTWGTIWRINFRFQGKGKTLVFGRYPETSLKDARAMCQTAREKIAKGIDPTVKEAHVRERGVAFRGCAI